MAYSGSYRPRNPAGADWEPPAVPVQASRSAPRPNEGMAQRLLPLLKKLEAIDLQTDDLLLLLILYLMYRESGDKELLFMMGAMLLP